MRIFADVVDAEVVHAVYVVADVVDDDVVDVGQLSIFWERRTQEAHERGHIHHQQKTTEC